MLYYTFKNYEEFKELFGIVKHGNGNESRKNKILLHFLKDRRLLHEGAVLGDYTLLHISDMATLKNLATQGIIRSGDKNRSLPYPIDLMGKRYYSSIQRMTTRDFVKTGIQKLSVTSAWRMERESSK